VGLVLFTDQVELYVPPRKGRRHGLRIVREILGFEPQSRGTDIVNALDFVNDVASRRSVVFLVSDFQAPGALGDSLPALRKAIRQTNRRHDLVALPIDDAREHALPDVGIITIEDAESGELIEIDTANENLRRRFAEVARDRTAELQRAFNSEAVDSLRITTDQSYVAPLMAFFKNRQRKR